VVTNVTIPPPGSNSTIHVDHPHVNVPPITAPPPVFLFTPRFSPNHNLNSISTMSIHSLPSQDTGQIFFQRLSTPGSSSNDDVVSFCYDLKTTNPRD
jgi:hypothetical protein